MRGVMDTVKSVTETCGPYLGGIVNMVKDAMPTIVDPHNAYWLYKGELPSFRRVIVGTGDILSTIHPNYLLVAFTFLFVFLVLYIKMKYPFWNQIPALHIYDWHRRFVYSEMPYIVHLLPKKTKYYESSLVNTKSCSDRTFDEKMEIAKLLQNSYFPSDRVFCSIQFNDLEAQFSGAVVSTFNQIEEDIVIGSEGSGNIMERIERTKKVRKIEGVASSRKILFAFSSGKSENRIIVQEPAALLDYICFRRDSTSPMKYRKLFHTHEYNSRKIWIDRNIMLFKKEVELCDAIVPLVEYDSFTFYLRHTIQPAKLPSEFQIIRIQKENTQHLHDWTERIASLKDDIGFRVSITAEIGDLIHLLQTNQMYAYALRGPDIDTGARFSTVYAMYFFRNAHMKYEDLEGGDTLHSVASFCNTNNVDIFFTGYLWAIREARTSLSGQETKMVMIDDIGHQRVIVQRWIATHDVILKTRCAYYFSNFILPRSPYKAEVVNILV